MFKQPQPKSIDDSNPFRNRAPRKDDPDLLRRRRTVAGMASWGGEGPAGTACWQCKWWHFEKFKADGTLSAEPCTKFAAMSGIPIGECPLIKPYQISCKYFMAPAEPRPQFAPRNPRRETASA